jgi:hypothetical protein
MTNALGVMMPEPFEHKSLFDHKIEINPVDHPGTFLLNGYVKMEVFNWLNENVGKVNDDLWNRGTYRAGSDTWDYFKPVPLANGYEERRRSPHIFSFANQSDLIIFKLTWGGVV